MKAVVHEKYGLPDVLEIREIDKPVMADDEVLVRVRAASLNMLEWHSISGMFIARMIGGGFFKPKDPRLGADFAGVVEAVGKSVTRFKPGDEVFGGKHGALAEYIAVREDRGIALKPANATFEQAAAIPVAGLTALQALRNEGQLQPGQTVLINGASGGVGTFAVQLAKVLGAEVTAVCHTRNVDQARSLGAEHVVDYTREDFTRSGQCYDLLIDIAGGRSWSEYKRVLKPETRFVLVGAMKTNHVIGPLSHVIKIRLAALRASQKVVFFIGGLKQEDLTYMKELFEAGKITSAIERQYKLNEIREALRYLGQGHARAKIVLTVE